MSNKRTTQSTPLILGVGASAGGLDAFQTLLSRLGDSPGVAIVLVQHLDPNRKSLLADLLSKATAMAVVELTGARKTLKANTVYICPPHRLIELKNGSVQLSDGNERPSHPIDHFLYSIAEDQGERGIGVILSGAGSDGTLGLKAIGDRGGLTFAQDAKSAKHDSMPRSAATTGVADHVLPPAEIAAALLQYVEHLHGLEELTSSGSRQDEIKEAVPKIAETLMAVTNHNFQHYKTNTLVRRIQRRMQVLQIGSVDEYVNHLQRHENEATSLFRELLIGVTEFFRDPDAFESLNRIVLPKLFAGRKPDDCVRIWVAGCANGSEAFTMAILCRESLDNMAAPCEVKIFATDIDERALSIAREGFYPVGIEDQVSPDRLKRFFVKRGKRYQVAKEIRDLVLFSSHNLISDPPFSRLDLVTCRNLLIYLGEHLQNMLIPLFHYALRPSGFLFLGPSENITSHVELFKPLDINYRISQRNGTAMGAVPGPKPSVSIRESLPTTLNQTDSKPDAAVDLTAIGQRIVLDEFAPRYAIVDEKGQILNSSANIDRYLSLGGGDYQNNIVRMVDPGLRIGLRAAIAEAKKVRRRVQHENMSIRVGDKMQRMMITVQPMPRLGENESLMMVVFHEVSLPVDLDIVEEQLESSRDAGSINAQMELELETMRSDLDRSLQDMEATNEELKSSNEELILMNEELQSANEEIRATSDAVERANADLENLLRSTQIATVFLDKDLNIRSFTPAIADIYSLIPTDVGRPLERLVPLVKDMPPLPDPMQVDGGETVEDTIVADSGKSYIRRVLPYRSRSREKQGVVVTFTDVSQLKESQELFELLIDASAQIVWMTNAEGFVTTDSPSWREFTGQAYDEWIGHGWIDAIHPDDREATMAKWNEAVQTGEVLSLEYRLRHRGGSYRWTQVRAVAQRSVDGSVRRWIGMNSDIDERKRNEEEIAATKERLQLCLEVSNVAPWHWDAETNDVVPNPILNRLFGFDEEDSPKIAEFIARIDPSARERVSTSIENAIKNGDTYDEEYPICWPNGEVRHVRGRGRARLSNDGAFADFFGVLIDISDRIVQEIDLAEREAHLRRVINNQLGLVGVIDRNGVLMEIDDRSLEIGHTRREAVIGKHFADAPWWTYDPAVAKQVRDAMERAFAGEIVRFDVSLFAHGKDGVLIDFMIAPVTDSSGKVEYLIPSGVDIVDRKRAEKEQQNISKRMRMALRAGGMAAWEWTPKESFWTPELYDLLGIDKNQKADSESFFSLVHPDDVEELKQSWQAAVDGTDEYECEFRIVRPSGEIRWTMGMGEVVRNNAGKVVRMYGINWDSTKDHLHEEALRESQQRAMQASASKSEFLANMSHEIRTPMTAILGYAELLKDLVDGDEAIQHLQTIRRNGNYLLDIINDILDLSKIEAGKFDVEYERFELARVIEDVRSIMEVRASEGGLMLAVEYDGKLPKVVQSDAKRLKQILINLVGNAIKFTPEGRVKIRVRYVSDESNRGMLHFDVVDTGIGMSTEQQEHLFKPFSQGDTSVTRNFGGTGLGLAISKRLAEMLGGEITVSSTEGVGSTFTVSIATGSTDSLHMVDYSGEDIATPQDTTKELGLPTLDCHILVVDDRRDIRFLSKRILTNAGATVAECEDGLIAVDHIAGQLKSGKCPDLILLDMQMPNLDGYETARRLRKLGYTSPIIALTADAMQGDMEECLEAGCNDYLAKPIDSVRLVELVASMLDPSQS